MKKIILTLLTAFFSWWAFALIFSFILLHNDKVFHCFLVGKSYPPPTPSKFCKNMDYLQLYVPFIPTALTTFFVYKKLSNKKKPAKKK
jgi:hypothetical protein